MTVRIAMSSYKAELARMTIRSNQIVDSLCRSHHMTFPNFIDVVYNIIISWFTGQCNFVILDSPDYVLLLSSSTCPSRTVARTLLVFVCLRRPYAHYTTFSISSFCRAMILGGTVTVPVQISLLPTSNWILNNWCLCNT